MHTSEINHVIASIAEHHHGLVSSRLARQHGLTADHLAERCSRHSLVRLDKGLYRIAEMPVTWHQRLLAAAWSQGPTAVASHRSAALLHGLDGVPGNPMLELVVPRWDRRTNRSNARLHESKDIGPIDHTHIDAIPCTNIVRTLIDLPSVLPEHWADRVYEDAFRRELCTVEEVTNRFVQTARRGRNGTRLGRQLLQKRLDAYVPTMSEFEQRVADLLEGDGLPRLAHQVPVRLEHATAYIDLGWPELKVGIQCDGLAHHGGIRRPWDDDRQNQLMLAGWLIVALTWQVVTETPETAISQVRTARSRQMPAPSTLLA